MSADDSDFFAEQKQGLRQLAADLRRERVAAARKAAMESAARIRTLTARVRSLARSGVQVTAVSHGAVQNLIELQGEIVSSALNEAAEQMQRMAYTESVRDLARIQSEVLQATRKRIVDDIARAVTILKGAAGDVRKVAQRAPARTAPPARKTVRRKKQAAARKTGRGKGKTAARARTTARKGAGRRRKSGR